MQRFANPNRFAKSAQRILPAIIGAMLILFAAGLYLALVQAPQDYQQGETVRIMFVHVPAAWMALLVYSLMAAAHGAAIVFRHPLADVAAKAAAPIGACFTFLALATGSLWGKPMWGAWWVWDARLTSMFVLFLLYLGYLAIWQASENGRGQKIARIVAIVGFINVPIVKFSVDWWNSLHQPASVFRRGGPTIDPLLLSPLIVMALAYLALFLALWLMTMKTEILKRRIHQMQIAAAEA
ncbi:MAG TPA: heme ABC transporter permease [Aestuariivirgaceae bacterium]|jgi:heme exporter protein C